MIGYFILKKYFDGKTLTIHVIDLFFKDTSQSNFNKLFKTIFSYINRIKKHLIIFLYGLMVQEK